MGLMKVVSFMKKSLRKIFKIFGLEINRFSKTPGYSMLGLKNLPIRSVIDIGANVGQFAKMISRTFPDARVYCFEPLPHAFENLREWAGKNEEKINAYNVALGETKGEVKILYHIDHSPSSSLLETTEKSRTLYPFTNRQEAVSVKLTTLDKFVSTLPEPPAKELLIKVDVQGYEDRVIKGGRNTFKRAEACILEICLEQLYESQAGFNDILLHLDSLGFRYAGNLEQTFGNDGQVIYIDAVFLRKQE